MAEQEDVHLTLNRREVEHKHITPDLHDADKNIARKFLEKGFPRAKEVKPPTLNYNCHGFALAPEHLAWYNSPDFLLKDNYEGKDMKSPQPGDILVYTNEAVISHTALVLEVSGSEVTLLQSKWGGIAEIQHHPSVVPDVYGEPIALMRPLPRVQKHPALIEAEKAAAEAAKTTEAAPASETTGGVIESVNLNATVGGAGQSELPERFMLMLASTPEVTRRILETRRSQRPADFPPFNALLSAEMSGEAAPSADEVIENALQALSGEDVQFGLMLASSPEVLRLAAAAQPPVRTLIEIGKTNPNAGRAVLEFFKRPETQTDEQITGLVLFLLSQLPLKEAVGPIAQYLSAGNFSSFNGGLAVDALGAAISKLEN